MQESERSAEVGADSPAMCHRRNAARCGLIGLHDANRTLFTFETRSGRTGIAARRHLRLNLCCSVRNHRHRAPGIAWLGLMLALVCLPGFCAIDHAQSLIQRPQARDSKLEQVTAKGRPFHRNAAGTLVNDLEILGHLGIPDPPGTYNAGRIGGVLAVLLGLMVVGGAAAIIAGKRDRKVYTGMDVERAAGTAPMAVLPDFSEVPNEVAEAHLMRLLSAMHSACKEHSPRNCIFTGVGAGAGTTTIAERVKEVLVTLGNAPLIVNATDASAAPESEDASWERRTAQHGGLTGALLQLLGNDAQGHQGQMVLADAAPVTTSAETEFLVERADCAIVVIESGATTRAQLRKAVNILQRLKAPAAGLVLNRVKLAKADRAFRGSVEEMTRSVQERSQLVEQQTLETLLFAVESGRASLEPQLDAQIGLSAEPTRNGEAEQVSFGAQPDRPVQASAPATQKEAGNVANSAQVDTVRRRRKDQWWLGEAAAHLGAAGAGAGDPKAASPRLTASGGEDKEVAGDATKATKKEDAHVRLPRLTELRGTMFSTGIKELDLARREAENAGEGEGRTGSSAPLEARPKQGENAQRAAHPQATPVKALLAAPKPEAAAVPANGTKAQGATPQADAAQPNVPSQKQRKGEKKKPPQDAGEPYDKVEILPSRRGQYKRKD